MENTQGGKDEFEVKMEADKEKKGRWVEGGVFFVLFVFWKISTQQEETGNQ